MHQSATTWLTPWRRTDRDTRSCWGYSFRWSPDHLSAEHMHKMKFTYDQLADECLNRLNQISPASSAELPRNMSRSAEKPRDPASPPKRDLYRLLREHAPADKTLGRLWTEVNTIPEWVDWPQIQRGQDVFYRYGGAALTGLAYQSLLGGMVRLFIHLSSTWWHHHSCDEGIRQLFSGPPSQTSRCPRIFLRNSSADLR